MSWASHRESRAQTIILPKLAKTRLGASSSSASQAHPSSQQQQQSSDAPSTPPSSSADKAITLVATLSIASKNRDLPLPRPRPRSWASASTPPLVSFPSAEHYVGRVNPSVEALKFLVFLTLLLSSELSLTSQVIFSHVNSHVFGNLWWRKCTGLFCTSQTPVSAASPMHPLEVQEFRG